MTKKRCVIAFLIIVMLLSGAILINNNVLQQQIIAADCTDTVEDIVPSEPQLVAEYTSLGVPNINSSFKTWMSYRAVTNIKSPQYNFIHTYGWSDEEGFMRCSGEADLGIEDDYYLIALGSYYGTEIGTKYKITLDTGRVFYGALADCKANKHTNSTNQYVSHNKNVVEFLVDTSRLNSNVKRVGSANVHMPLNGSIIEIEKINFIYK